MLRYQRSMHSGATHPASIEECTCDQCDDRKFCATRDTKVVVITVILRSLSFSMVREAITPGTPHPLPISIGIKDLPESPNLRKILSMINATLAMYPQDSKNARKMNSTNICGTNPRTAPTPPTTPSAIRLVSQSAQ